MNTPVRRPPAKVVLFNKPWGVLSQFTDADGHPGLAHYLSLPGYRVAGRLDRDSEGLLVLTNDGALQQRLTHPKAKKWKTYVVQVEGEVDRQALTLLQAGPTLKDGPTRPCRAKRISEPAWLWPRDPPVRFRKAIPTSWIEMSLSEGRNRQIRRMTASVGLPTLRLIRTRVGAWSVNGLALTQSRDAPLD